MDNISQLTMSLRHHRWCVYDYIKSCKKNFKQISRLRNLEDVLVCFMRIVKEIVVSDNVANWVTLELIFVKALITLHVHPSIHISIFKQTDFQT